MVRCIRTIAAAVGAAAALWALRVLILGAVTITVAGYHIRSRSAARPTEIAAGAFLAFALSGGVAAGRKSLRELAQRKAIRLIMSPPVIVAAIALATFVVSVAFSSAVAGGADSSGYVSQADRWLQHTLKPTEPWAAQVPWPNAAWTFTPLGYTPIDDGPPFRQAPTYSPGLPLLMAAAKAIGGHVAMFLVVPLSTALLVLATFGVGRRLAGAGVGLIAAWLIATSPILIAMSLVPMSDVPAGAAWTGAFYFLLGDSAVAAVSAGLTAALAMVIRPNLFFLAAIMGLWFLIRRGRVTPTLFHRIRDLAAFGLAVAPGVIFIGLLFDYYFGSPFVSGYGRFSDSLSWSHVADNAPLYWHWALGAQTSMTIAGLIGLGVPFVWPRGDPRRAMVVAAAMVAGVVAEYLSYLVYSNWLFLRFFLPVWAFLALGAAGVIDLALKHVPVTLFRAAVLFGVAAVGIVGVLTARDRFAFEGWYSQRRYVGMSEIVKTVTVPNSAVFAMEQSGALRYYSGRVPIRYDVFDGAWLDRGVDWLAASGVHSYAALDEWEIEQFRSHFPGQRKVSALQQPIVVYHAYRDSATVYLFDLTTPPAESATPTVVIETEPWRLRAMTPGPWPSLVFHVAR